MSVDPQSEDSRETATMDISDDERGVSVVLGAVLMFGIAIIALTSFQAAVVPQENQQVEFNHYSGVKDDMQQLGAEIESASRDDVQSSQGINLGTTYPTRAVAVNPPPATGRLQKTNTESGFSGIDSKICGGGTSTFGVKYTPDYNEMNAQEVHYENGQVFVKEGGKAAFLDKRTVIDAREDKKTITLYRLVGDIPTESEASEVNVRIVGTSSYGEGSLPAGTDLMVPSELSADEWKANLVDGSYGGTIENVNNGVEIKDLPSGYSVTCYVVALGEETPPGDGKYGDNLAEDEDDDKIGTGGSSEYPDRKTATISSKGGTWTGIDKPDRIVFSEPKFPPTDAQTGQAKTNERHLRTVLAITNSEDDTRYYIDVGGKKGLRYNVNNKNKWDDSDVTLYKQTPSGTDEYSSDICDGNGDEDSCGEQITPKKFVGEGQKFNPLNLDHVHAEKEDDDDEDDEFDEYAELANEITELLKDDDVEVELFITDQHGRVRISLEETS